MELSEKYVEQLSSSALDSQQLRQMTQLPQVPTGKVHPMSRSSDTAVFQLFSQPLRARMCYRLVAGATGWWEYVVVNCLRKKRAFIFWSWPRDYATELKGKVYLLWLFSACFECSSRLVNGLEPSDDVCG